MSLVLKFQKNGCSFKDVGGKTLFVTFSDWTRVKYKAFCAMPIFDTSIELKYVLLI